MRVRVFQHVPFEGLGAIEPWLTARGAEVSTTRFFANDPIPPPDAYDWLVAMGGPMSVNDEAALPWLRAEKRAIAAAIDGGRTVVGVCLGAQLVASSLGAKVGPNREREIGWFEIERLAGADAHPLGAALPPRVEVFHWHGETFELPPGARHLARSEACEAQAFAIGPRVLGMQFHLDTRPAMIEALAEECPGDLRGGRYVQSREQMLADPKRFDALHALLARWLDVLAAA